MAGAANRANDHLVNVYVLWLRDRIQHGTCNGLGGQRNAAQLSYGLRGALIRDVVTQLRFRHAGADQGDLRARCDRGDDHGADHDLQPRGKRRSGRPLGARIRKSRVAIYMELLMILFRINDGIQEIGRNTRR